MTEPMPCPSCQSAHALGGIDCSSTTNLPEFRCCSDCSGDHENDTYARYYPTPTKENNR